MQGYHGMYYHSNRSDLVGKCLIVFLLGLCHDYWWLSQHKVVQAI